MIRRKSASERIEKASKGWYNDVLRIVGEATIANLVTGDDAEVNRLRVWMYRVKNLKLPACMKLYNELTRMGWDIPPPSIVIRDAMDWEAIQVQRQLRGLMGEEEYAQRIKALHGQVDVLREHTKITRSQTSPKRPKSS